MTHRLRVYVAGPWAHRIPVRGVRDKLEAAGYVVTSRWLDVDETKTTPAAEAAVDLEDIARADLLVVYNSITSEGKAVEQGYALGLGIPIIVIGDREALLNVFQHLQDRFLFVNNSDDCLEAIRWYDWVRMSGSPK